jgi:GT2 family glycosyltransferase
VSPDPAATVSLVTWNGMRWLPACLASVATQTMADYELLVIDNASSDGSAAWLRAQAAADPRIRLVESVENTGYARAHNANIRVARGEAILLLNQDAVLDPGFLEATVGVLRDHPEVGSVQGRLRRLGPGGQPLDILDTTGLVMHRDRRVVSRAQLSRDEWPDGAGPAAGPVWGVDGAAPVYRRSALAGARLPRRGGGWEVLDEDFFMYKEDVDLAWRLRRLGWTAWYEPAALAWHARGSGDTGASSLVGVVRANLSNPPHIRALSWRNQRLMQVKNEDLTSYLHDLPWIARRELLSWGFILAVDPGRLRALPGLLRALPWAMRKRRALAARIARAGLPGVS